MENDTHTSSDAADNNGSPDDKPVNENNDKPDYKVAMLSLFGMAGFVAGFIILFFIDLTPRKSIFHEIGYQPRRIACGIIETSINQLNASIKERSKKISLNKDTITIYTDSITGLDKSLQQAKKELEEKKNILLDSNTNALVASKKDSLAIQKLLVYKPYYEDENLPDSLAFEKLNKALHFDIDFQDLSAWDKGFDTSDAKWSDSVTYFFKDESIPFSGKGKVKFSILPYESNIAFIIKYPGVGVWILLIVVLCSFSAIAIAQCCYLETEIVANDNNKIDIATHQQYYVIAGIILVILTGITVMWLHTFYDDFIIKNIYFLKTITKSFIALTVVGYIAGSLCLAGFVYTTAMITCLTDALKNKRIALQNEIVPEKIKLLTAEIENNRIAYNNLLTYFNTYFILSATILSLMTLCTGALFNTVNSLDFIKLLQSDWGYSPARADFVYLYAGIYTVILLLIYIPGKMRFEETKALVADNKGSGATGQVPVATTGSANGLLSFFKDPFSSFKGVLLATSPLLSSLVQMLLDTLFKG